MFCALNARTDSTLYEAMFEQVMRSLRWHVEELEEEDTTERVLQRRIKAIVETHASASDIDVIMESLMESVEM